MSDRAILKTLGHYVYALLRPDDWPKMPGLPFYIGKGSGRRVLLSSRVPKQGSCNPHKDRLIKQIMAITGMDEIPWRLIGSSMTEEEAFMFEMKMIRHYRRVEDGGCLVNLNDGGEGGSSPSKLIRAKMSASHKGVAKTPEHRAKIGAANKGRRQSIEVCAKGGAAGKGRKQSPEHIAKRVAACRAKRERVKP